MRAYGYTSDDEIIAEEASVLEAAALTVLEKRSLRAAVQRASAEAGRKFDPRSLKRMLISPRIAGLSLDLATGELRKTHEEILDRATWEAVTAVLTMGDRANAPRTTVREYMLTGGIALCALCKAPLQAAVQTGSSGSAASYRCLNKEAGCGKVRVSRKLLDTYVGNQVLAAVHQDAISGGHLSKVIAQARSDAREARALLASLPAKREALAAQAGDLAVGGKAVLRIATDALEDQAQEAGRLIEAESRLSRFADPERLSRWWDSPSTTIEDQRAVVSLVISRVEVAPATARGKGAVTRIGERVSIHWRSVTTKPAASGSGRRRPAAATRRAAADPGHALWDVAGPATPPAAGAGAEAASSPLFVSPVAAVEEC